jgi:hypothetical protein
LIEPGEGNFAAVEARRRARPSGFTEHATKTDAKGPSPAKVNRPHGRCIVAGMDMVAVAYAVLATTGGLLVVRRLARDRRRQGQLSRHDGRLLAAPSTQRAGRARYRLRTQRRSLTEWRLAVQGVEVAALLGFRLEGSTTQTAAGLAGRLIVEKTKGSGRARRLFARAEVNEAIAALCGSAAAFKRVDLFPGGDLAIVARCDKDVARADLAERMLQLAEALDDAVPFLEDDDIDLGATSGTTSSAAFSIEIRS